MKPTQYCLYCETETETLNPREQVEYCPRCRKAVATKPWSPVLEYWRRNEPRERQTAR